MWLVHKETKILNKVDKWCVVLSHGDFEGMEFHGDKIWAKVITDIPETTHFPINDPSVKNPNKNKFHWKGNKRRTLHQNKPFVKISMKSDHNYMKLITAIIMFPMTYQTW